MNDIIETPVHSVEDLAYTAGFFDGEGCISITVGRHVKRITPIYSLVAKVSNTDRAILEWLQSTFGGDIVKHHSRNEKRVGTIWNPAWAWKVTSNKAMKFLKLICPYLKIKQRSASLAIEFQLFFQEHTFRFPANRNQDVFDKLESYRQQINSTTATKEQWETSDPLNAERHTTADLCYAAGFFDGEGTIGIGITQPTEQNKQYNPSYRLRIKIGTTDYSITKWLNAVFKGSMRDCASEPSRSNPSKEKHKPAWEWVMNAKTAQHFLELIAPYLKIKGEQAILAIEFQSYASAHSHRGCVRNTEEVQNKKEDYRQRIRDLKLIHRASKIIDENLVS